MIFKSFSLLCAHPVHEKTILYMVAKGADNHVHPDPECSYPCEKPCYQRDHSEGFCHYGKKSKCCRETGFRCKDIHSGAEPDAAEPAEDLLHAVWKEYQAEEKP